MSGRKARIERVITGVLRQVFDDAGVARFALVEPSRAAAYAAELCRAAGAIEGAGLAVGAATKTELLLGAGAAADVLPLGDLYHTQLVELIGAVPLAAELAELANACGGAETLDRVLQSHFDERFDWNVAAAPLEPRARVLLMQRLAAARFRRGRTGVVPKIGSRTLGIDLNA